MVCVFDTCQHVSGLGESYLDRTAMASSDLLTLTVNPVIACREHRRSKLGCVREEFSLAVP